MKPTTDKEINSVIRKKWKQLSDRKLAELCGISINAIQHRRSRMGFMRGKTEPHGSPAGIVHDKSMSELRTSKSISDKKYKDALKIISLLEAERDAAFEIRNAPFASHRIKATRGKDDSEATAFAIASDWHIEETVKKETVNGMNDFNLDEAKKRADLFFERIVRLVRKEQQDVHIDNLVLGLLGDFITGRLHEENLENCSLRPMEAVLLAEEMIASGLLFLLENTKLKITVVCCVGNHGRITKRVHHSTEQGNSIETYLYRSLQRRFEFDGLGKGRTTFIIGEGYHVYLPVYNSMIRFHHGHNVSYGGGVGGLTIPLNKAIHQWNYTQRADLDVMGHWHQNLILPNAMVNGSLIGYNAFALAIKASYERPTQSFFLWDKKRRRTVIMPIFLD